MERRGRIVVSLFVLFVFFCGWIVRVAEAIGGAGAGLLKIRFRGLLVVSENLVPPALPPGSPGCLGQLRVFAEETSGERFSLSHRMGEGRGEGERKLQIPITAGEVCATLALILTFSPREKEQPLPASGLANDRPANLVAGVP